MELIREAKVNTKGCCFLCLESEDMKMDKARDSISIRYLLQHLQISLKDNKDDVNVDLCKSCEKTLKGFTIVFEEVQKAKIKMNYFLEQISKSISGSKDSKRVQVYSKRMTGDPETLAQLAIVDNLRKELAVKSLKYRVGPIPCVKLKRTEFQKQFYSKIKQEADEQEGDVIGEEVEDSFTFDGCNNEVETMDTSNSPSDSNGLSPRSEVQEVKFHPAPATSSDLESQPTRKIRRRKSNRLFENLYYTRNAKTGIYHCKKCSKTCRSSTNIIGHYQRIHLRKRYPCDICKISEYGTLQRLVNHKRICRDTMEERLAKEKERENSKFVCNSCGKKFRTREVLVQHQQVHNNAPRHPCDLCSKKFTKLFNLKAHKDAIHFGKVFSCRFCQNQYKGKSSLWHHQNICQGKSKFKTEPLNQ